MRELKVHDKTIVLRLNRREADALTHALTTVDGSYCNALVEGKTTRDLRAKLAAAIAEVING